MTLHQDIRGDIIGQTLSIAHAAATATEVIASWAAPNDIKVTKITWRPTAAITGANTNTTHLNLINAGKAGNGATEIGNKDFVQGVNAASGEEITLYAPSAPVAYEAGNLFKLAAEKVGNGLAIPAGVLLVYYRNN